MKKTRVWGCLCVLIASFVWVTDRGWLWEGGRVGVAYAPKATNLLASHATWWITRLAQEEGFSSWRDSTWHAEKLPPLSHIWWIALYGRGQQPVGHLVLSVTEAQSTLLEYGHGPSSLYPAMDEESARTRRYLHPLYAVWSAPQQNNDAPTVYEAWSRTPLPHLPSLPMSPVPVNACRVTLPPSKEIPLHVRTPSEIVRQEPPNPYMNIQWIDEPAVEIQDAQAWHSYYDASARIYNAYEAVDTSPDAATLPYGIGGYHRFSVDSASPSSPCMYIALATDSVSTIRYVPLDTLNAYGRFH